MNTYQSLYRKLYGTKPPKTFRKDMLPNPEDYYARQFSHLKGYGNWRQTLCPFHDDHNPSFSINLESGGYYCFTCCAKGGDVLAFHRAITGMGFVEAAKDLGAWA